MKLTACFLNSVSVFTYLIFICLLFRFAGSEDDGSLTGFVWENQEQSLYPFAFSLGLYCKKIFDTRCLSSNGSLVHSSARFRRFMVHALKYVKGQKQRNPFFTHPHPPLTGWVWYRNEYLILQKIDNKKTRWRFFILYKRDLLRRRLR